VFRLLGGLADVFALIAAGYLLYRARFLPAEFWPPAERLTYYVLLPALLVSRMAVAPLGGLNIGAMAGVLVATVCLAGGLVWLLRSREPSFGPAFTSLFQGSIRPNTYVGIASAMALYGDHGLTLAAIALAILVPVVNVLSVVMLQRYGTGDSSRSVLSEVVRNPLVLASLAGIGLNLSGIGMAGVAHRLLDMLGRAALPMGLMAVGAGLDWARAWSERRSLVLVSGYRLLAVPLAAAGLCVAFGLRGETATVAVLFTGVPASASSYILARQLGGDTRLMAGILTVQTAMAAFTLPAVLLLAARL